MLITTQGPAYLWGGVISAQGDLQPSSGGTIIVLSGYQHPSGGSVFPPVKIISFWWPTYVTIFFKNSNITCVLSLLFY